MTKSSKSNLTGALRSLLVIGAVTLVPAAYSESASSPIVQPATSGEVFFVEIQQSDRNNADFPANFGSFRSALAGTGFRLDQVWVGENKLYLRVVLVGDKRADAVASLQAKPLVAKVISSASAPSELQGVQLIQKFGANDAISAAKLRGFPEKRRQYKPDLSVPNTGEIVVKYLRAETDTPTRAASAKARVAAIHAQHKAKVKQSFTAGNAAVELVELSDGASFADALQAYLDSEDVEYAQPNYIYTAYATPNDPSYTNGTLWGMNKISAPSAWNTRTGSGSVVVAVTDTGIDYNHPDLAGNMWQNPSIGAGGWNDGQFGYDAYSNDSDPIDDNAYYDAYGTYRTPYHGTHVAGTIGAVGNNATGVTGVAWQTKLMAVKVLGANGSGGSASFARGLDYAREKGAKIINASLGWTAGGAPNDTLVNEAIGRLRDAGVVFVNAAGNDYNDNDVTPTYPASIGMPNMVVVGNSTDTDARNASSSYGRWSVDVFAPGTNIYSTRRYNSYQSLGGTSMAAPHVAGMLALAKAQFPWESARELVDRARFSTDSVGALQSVAMSGGRINASKSLSTRPTLYNLSTRCFVNTGDQIAIAGIVISGTSSKRVAFRAQGPTLANYGVSNVLANPQITIFNVSGQQIGHNDNWGTLSSSEQAELSNAGIAPSNSLESAWVATLAPGNYTVHLSGVSGGTGNGIIESFALDGATATRLVNVSTRCYVGTGDSIGIAGMIVSGDKPRQVYIRALGPTLGAYGVSGALQDTMLTLYDGSGNVIATNDDWRTFDGSSTALDTRLTQRGDGPPDNRESAIVMRLNPGNYTAFITGKNGTTGVGLIEVNEY